MGLTLLALSAAFAAGFLAGSRRRAGVGAAREVWTALRSAQVGEFLSYALYQLREYLISVTTAVESLALAAPKDDALLAERLERLKRLVGELNAKAARLLGDASPLTIGRAGPAAAFFKLAPLVREAAAEAREAFADRRVSVSVIADELPEIAADPRVLKLCLLAVLQNSLEACLRRGKGSVSVVLRRAGAEAEIEVIDDGGGIAPALQETLYEPLFSARPEGRGLGLGLAMSRRMIERQGGSLRIKSREAYTAALLSLPLSRQLPVVRNEESTWSGRRDRV